MDSVPQRLARRLAWKLGNGVEAPRELRLIGDGPLDRADLETALANLSPMLRPAPPQALAAALAELRSLTCRPSGSEVDLVATAWVERLATWPADIAIWALREWPSRSKWWPTWHEIEGLMERRAHERLELYRRMKARGGLQVANGPRN